MAIPLEAEICLKGKPKINALKKERMRMSQKRKSKKRLKRRNDTQILKLSNKLQAWLVKLRTAKRGRLKTFLTTCANCKLEASPQPKSPKKKIKLWVSLQTNAKRFAS